MCKDNILFGWRAVFKQYGWHDLFKDIVYPLTITIILVIIALCFSTVNIFCLLQSIINIGLSVVPTIIALILAAYTIIMAFMISDKMNAVQNTEKGRDLIKALNAGFASSLLFSTISIIFLVITSNIISMKIYSPYSDVINFFVFGFICFLVILSITILFGVILDIFNSGQTALINESKETKKRKDETSSTSV